VPLAVPYFVWIHLYLTFRRVAAEQCGMSTSVMSVYFDNAIYTVSQKKLSRFVFVRTLSNLHKFR